MNSWVHAESNFHYNPPPQKKSWKNYGSKYLITKINVVWTEKMRNNWNKNKPSNPWAILSTHTRYWKWYQTIPLHTHSLPLNSFENLLSFLFCIISKNSFRYELHEPFIPIFDTQHSICVFFYFILFKWGSQKTYKLFLCWVSQKCSKRE